MKKTVFYDSHVAMGGKMVPFAGFEMPVEFSGVRNEHIHVRKKAGVFDVSHMGEIWVKGPNAAAFVQKVTSNDIQQLTNGRVQYSCFPNDRGGVVDDLLVYRIASDIYLLVVNASNIEKDWDWLVSQNSEGAELINESDNTSQLAIQGPYATKIIQKLTDTDLTGVPYYHFTFGKIGSADNVLISNTGYTGAGGFELYFKNEHGQEIFDALMEAGKEYELMPAGLASRDTLRLEMGFCLYGNELNDTTSPLEAGLGWITKFVEGNNFIHREYLETQKEEGLKKKLVGFELLERGIPRHGYPITDEAGEVIGEVSSGTMSPLTSKAIGMGYVNTAYSKPGASIFIEIRNKQIPAKVVRPPFFTAGDLG